jgi:malate synthase
MSSVTALQGVRTVAPLEDGLGEIITSGALDFVTSLHLKFSGARKDLLRTRQDKQMIFDSGGLPGFLVDSDAVRNPDWRVSAIPLDLLDRRVEITGPAGDRKMVINALNSGASTYMADFEDSQSPTWHETVRGQINLRDVVDKSISFRSPEGKEYSLVEHPATLIVRPRGWHLLEKHVLIDGEPVSASLFDFGVFLFTNARKLLDNNSGPYFYLPKIESHLEARLWEQVFVLSEDLLGLPRGAIKATVLIETLPAVFEMEDILFELRQHIVGLNCGRWDYIFSYIKKLKNHPEFVLPDRSQVSMGKAFLAAYVNLLIKTCHKRGAYAIGGMSAYIPVKGDEQMNAAAFEKVRADKEREFILGHDGTSVAHPGLVPLAREILDFGPGKINQLNVLREDVDVSRDDLLKVPEGEVTEEGIEVNVDVGLRYLDSWLAGKGCVPINNMMEDAATVEISRAQIWQWVRHSVNLPDGRKVTAEMVRKSIASAVTALASGKKGAEDAERAKLAGKLFETISLSEEFPDFLTLPAYDVLLSLEDLRK